MQMTAERTWERVTVENVLIAPLIENSPLPGVNAAGHRAVYHLAIPKIDEHLWQGQLVQFWGSTWAVIGVPTMGIDELIPGTWNKKAVVELYRTAAPEPAGLWTDTVTLLTERAGQDEDGYKQNAVTTSRDVSVIFTEGVNAEEHTEAEKSGVRHSATAEIWTGDYQEERALLFDSRRYTILSRKPTGRGTLLLRLEEVWR